MAYLTCGNATAAVWYSWAATTATSANPACASPPVRVAPPVTPMTPEEAKRRKRAEQRAKKLLYRHLSRDQIRSLCRARFFDVEAPSGRVYRLERGMAGNVKELQGGKPIRRLCIHPSYEFPVADNLLAQKLAIETDEEGFRRTANFSGVN